MGDRIEIPRHRSRYAKRETVDGSNIMKKRIDKGPRPKERQFLLLAHQRLKMAESAHAFMRGSTAKFYEWLKGTTAQQIPLGPEIWICGDCHLGNLGPVSNVDGSIDIQIRDLDQSVIGNPAHDLIRLGLSLAIVARGSNLPGLTTAVMLEEMMEGYTSAFQDHATEFKKSRPDAVRLVMKKATTREWAHLAKERLEAEHLRIPLGKAF